VTWRELAITLSVLLAYDLLSACYAQHEAEPCEDYRAEGSNVAGGSAPLGISAAPRSPTIYPGPCPFKYDAVHCYCTDATHEVCDGRYCEGPYVGCIAPNSPMSSTWVQR
jgi:hypothetical protein